MKINTINDSVFKSPSHAIVAMLYNWYLRQDESLRMGGGGGGLVGTRKEVM